MNVRPMHRGDVAAVAAIEARMFGDPWPAASFTEMLAQRHTIALVGEHEDDTVIGYAIGTSIADEGEILNLAVDAPWQRRGFGRALVERLLEELEERGAQALYLEVRASNQAAIGLYEGFGFRPMGRRKAYYRAPREDAVTMVRKVDTRTAKK